MLLLILFHLYFDLLRILRERGFPKRLYAGMRLLYRGKTVDYALEGFAVFAGERLCQGIGVDFPYNTRATHYREPQGIGSESRRGGIQTAQYKVVIWQKL